MDTNRSPVLSVVVVIVSDTTEAPNAHLLGDCLEALAKQVDAPPFEVIVPHVVGVAGLETVQDRHPWVRFLPVPDVVAHVGGREHHDVLRARGLAAARGEIVGLLEDHARPDARWCANVVAAHQQPYAGVGGAIENGLDHPLNWAVYYCDFGRYQNPVPAGETPYASDANVTYKRADLERVRPVWEGAFREVVVNGALKSEGRGIALDPRIVVYQHRRGLNLATALRERFVWGRSYAATRRALLTGPKRFIHAALSPLLPAVLLLRMARTSWDRGSIRSFVKAVHFTILLLVTWSAGEGIGYLLGLDGKAARVASPARTS
jgi:hypothetical protein